VLRRVLDPYPSGSGIDLSWKFTPEASGNIARARRFSTHRILLIRCNQVQCNQYGLIHQAEQSFIRFLLE
jgi:hypothetical protein